MDNNKKSETTKMLDKYCAFVAKNFALPTTADLLSLGITRKYRDVFGNMRGMDKAARKHKPEAFSQLVTEKLFDRDAIEKVEQKVGKHSWYFVTTAVLGCDVWKPFYDTITNFAKRKKALPLILTAQDPAAAVAQYAKKQNPEKWFVDILKSFPGLQLVVADLALNDNIFLSAIKLTAKQLDPITGLGRLGQRNGSFIFASPKQRLKLVPTSNEDLPHAMMTTGAVTRPNYDTDLYKSDRLSVLATNDHVMGGIIVEVPDDTTFHFRQAQADKRGGFIDMGIHYKADGTATTVRPEALVLGDWHSGETDPDARQAFVGASNSLITRTKPKRLVIHDGFNGMSVSHHEAKNATLRAQRAAANQLSLEAELTTYMKDLEYLASFPFVDEVVVVWSNHDAFLTRYIEDGRYIEDPQNYKLGLELAHYAVGSRNPIQAFVERRGIKNLDKLVWLNEDQDYKVAGVELGTHGHRGANGARGSLHAMEDAYSNSISGHAHTPEILRGAWQVGTCSKLKLNYNKGVSSWLHSSCLLYSNGARQLINVIYGQFCSKGE